MKTYNIFTQEIDTLAEGKADFLLITTPPLYEAEFITTQKGLDLLETEESYSFSLITRAIHNLYPFSAIETIKLTNDSKTSSHAKDTFAKGMRLGSSYELKGSYLILAQSSSNIALQALQALKTLQTLQNTTEMSNFDKLSFDCDNTLLFCAGFLLEASRRFHVVLGGGIEMAITLFIADTLREDVLMRLKPENITYATTVWAAQNPHAKNVLNQLSYKPHAIYTKVDFKEAEIEKLKKYTEKNPEDGAGAGAALAYGVTNGLTNKDVLDEMELIIYMA